MDIFLKKRGITHLIHIAGLSRPMNMHEKNINKSIELNIVATANLVRLVTNITLKLFIFRQIMFIQEIKVIIKKPIVFCRLTIMHGQN